MSTMAASPPGIFIRIAIVPQDPRRRLQKCRGSFRIAATPAQSSSHHTSAEHAAARRRRQCPKAAKRAERSGEHSRQSHSAHHTEHVTVHYPWHPLHGQTIAVRRSVRHGRDVWLCEHDQRTAAIPVWMTDAVACAALSVGPVLVSVEALTELASLVNATRSGARSRHRFSAGGTMMRRRPPRQLPMPFEREGPALPAQTAQVLAGTPRRQQADQGGS
jgi:Family of unknown function (DUF5372)